MENKKPLAYQRLCLHNTTWSKEIDGAVWCTHCGIQLHDRVFDKMEWLGSAKPGMPSKSENKSTIATVRQLNRQTAHNATFDQTVKRMSDLSGMARPDHPATAVFADVYAKNNVYRCVVWYLIEVAEVRMHDAEVRRVLGDAIVAQREFYPELNYLCATFPNSPIGYTKVKHGGRGRPSADAFYARSVVDAMHRALSSPDDGDDYMVVEELESGTFIGNNNTGSGSDSNDDYLMDLVGDDHEDPPPPPQTALGFHRDGDAEGSGDTARATAAIQTVSDLRRNAQSEAGGIVARTPRSSSPWSEERPCCPCPSSRSGPSQRAPRPQAEGEEAKRRRVHPQGRTVARWGPRSSSGRAAPRTSAPSRSAASAPAPPRGRGGTLLYDPTDAAFFPASFEQRTSPPRHRAGAPGAPAQPQSRYHTLLKRMRERKKKLGEMW